MKRSNRPPIRVLLVTLAILAGAESAARAQALVAGAQAAAAEAQQQIAGISSEELKGAARLALGRARRMVALGPTLGGGVLYAPSAGDVDGALTFGLGLAVFHEDLFDPAAMQERIVARVKQKLKERLEEWARRGQVPTREETEQLARDALAEVKAEIRDAVFEPPSRFPDPKFTMDLEGAYLLGASAGQVRLGFGIGVSKLTVGVNAAFKFGDGTALYLAPELAAHLLATRGPRSPVLTIFARYDLSTYNRDDQPDVLTIGLRMMFDVI